MTHDELRRLLDVGRDHACLVDLVGVPGCPGYVRTVQILPGCRVRIEFDVWGMDEGGLYFEGRFDDMGDLLEAVESFLDRDIAEWQPLDFHADYPDRPDGVGTPESHAVFMEYLRHGPPLPAAGEFVPNDGFYTQFLPAGP